MSERARALEQAREWQAIAYGDRPETWAALDYYRELGWPVDSNKFPERERVEGRIFAFMSGYREALKAAVDHPPPSGASPQAEISQARQLMAVSDALVGAPISPVEPTGASPFRLTDWIPTAGCDCEKCTAQREAEPPTGASPQAETREDMGDGRETALKLEQALRMLRNECHAIMAMSYDAIKDSAGYTNLKVWLSRVEEADALLASPLSAPPTARSAPPAA